MNPLRTLVSASALGLLALPALGQQPSFLADQFQVNQVIGSAQARSAVAYALNHTFVVVWESYSSGGNDNSARSIQAQRYSLDGQRLGGQFQVNTTIAGEQKNPSVAVDPTGRIAVVFESDQGGSPVHFDIRARFFQPDGTPFGPDVLVNTWTADDQFAPVLAYTGGGYLVLWQSDDDPSSTQDWNIVARAFDVFGAPLTGELAVNGQTAGDQQAPAIAVGVSDNFLAAWQSSTSVGNDNNTLSIQARWIGNGPIADEFQVNDHPPQVNDSAPAVAVGADGSAIVAWESFGSSGNDNSRYSIQARRYDPSGTPGTVFQANSYITDDQRFPAVALDTDGTAVVAWQSYGSSGNDASLESIQVRAFNAANVPFNADRQANTYTNGAQLLPAIAMSQHGDVVVTWESNGSPGSDQNGFSIQARRMSARLLFADGFATGNTSRWSVVQP